MSAMYRNILALFAELGPMTVSEAMAKGLGQICGTYDNYSARYHLNQLLSRGELVRNNGRRPLRGGIGRYPRQGNVVINQVKPQ